jgi:HK97 family phage major capsid protein
MDQIKALHEEYASIHKDASDLLAKTGGKLTAEDKESQAKMFARMDEIKATKFAIERLAENAFANYMPSISRAEAEFAQSQPLASKLTAKDEINMFLRGDTSHKFVLVSTSGSSIMLPKEVMAPIAVRRNVNPYRAALAARGYQPIESTATDQVTLPVWDDTSANGDAPSESATADTTVDSTLTGSLTLNATLYESKSKWFSNTLLNANGFDVLGYLAPILTKQLDKGQESAATVVAKALTVGYTGSSNSGLTYADLIAWEHTLKPAYRSDAVFIVSDGTYKAMRGLVDANSRPIIDLDPTNNFMESFHGKPLFVGDFFDAPAVSAFGGIFVSADAIKIRDVVPQRLTRYVNIPTKPDQTGFNLFANGDCQFVAAGVSLFQYKTS